MADVRSLLRQQREARRIDHPHAAYSDAGKLLCTLCREQVRTEALWDNHLQTTSHRQNAQRSTRPAAAQVQDQAAERRNETSNDLQATAVEDFASESTVPSHPKRKHSRDSEGDEIMDDAVRRKRSRPDINDSDKESATATRPNRANSETLTPPTLARRPSTTPSQGIELQIPSRPATPSHRDGSSASTPGTAASSSLANGTAAKAAAKDPSSNAVTAGAATGDAENTPSTAQVDESEWAAFEADIAAASAPYDNDATISAPAMTAEEAAAAQAQASKDDSGRKSKADVDLEDEKEEATRALEEEFEDMEELEARVQRLREKREDIRKKRSESQGQATATAPSAATKLNGLAGKENAVSAVVEEDDDDDEEDDDDDWDSFRLRGR